jgi:hypothetical protein
VRVQAKRVGSSATQLAECRVVAVDDVAEIVIFAYYDSEYCNTETVSDQFTYMFILNQSLKKISPKLANCRLCTEPFIGLSEERTRAITYTARRTAS